MKINLICLILIFIVNVYSQAQNIPGEQDVFIPPQSFGIPLLNGSGSSGIENNISNIVFINPASISKYPNYNFALSYQFQSKIANAYPFDIGTGRVYNIHPQSIGGVFHYSDFTFGIGFGQKYNGTMDYGPISIVTTQDRYGTDQIYFPTIEKVLNCYSVIASYTFNNLFIKNSNLTLGLRYNLNEASLLESIVTLNLEHTFAQSLTMKTRFLLEFHLNPAMNLEQ